MKPALQLQEVHMRFGAVHILKGLSLEVAVGERLALVGPNGAGKSTLFNLISGKFAPSAGQVWLHGQRISGKAPHAIHRLGLARSFQITQVFARLSVLDNLRCACLASLGLGLNPFKRLSRLSQANERAEALMERLGLADRRSELAGTLSYAEQRALELGITLMGEPSVLLLDEPTAGMSRSEAARVVALIRELTQGRTVVMVEHDMGVVYELADRIAVLDQGQWLACDSPERVRSDPRVQQAYLQDREARPC